MIDEQVKKIIDRTFSEVDILVKEVQQKKKFEKNDYRRGEVLDKKKFLLNREHR